MPKRAQAAAEPVYELELLRVGPVLCNPIRDWCVGGDYATLDEAKAALRKRLRAEPIYQAARVRQYGSGRSRASTAYAWMTK